MQIKCNPQAAGEVPVQLSPWYSKLRITGGMRPATYLQLTSLAKRRQAWMGPSRGGRNQEGLWVSKPLNTAHPRRQKKNTRHSNARENETECVILWRADFSRAPRLPTPSSSMLHPSLHCKSQNLFVGSVYRCSSNAPPKKTTRKTSNIGEEEKKKNLGRKSTLICLTSHEPHHHFN